MKRLFLALNVMCFAFIVVDAQQVEGENFELKSPYSAVYTHLYNLQSDAYNPEISKKAFGKNGTEKEAIQLKQILDGKGLLVIMEDLPIDSNYIDTSTVKNIYSLFPEEIQGIYLEKRGGKWYYSKETRKIIPKLHQKIYPFGANLLVDLFPKLGQDEILGLKVWQWLGALILLILCGVIYKLINLIISPILRRILKTRFNKVIPDNQLVWKVTKLLSLLLVFEILIRLLPILQLSIDISQAIFQGIKIVQTVFFILLLLGIVDLVIFYFKLITDKTESTLDNQLLPIIRTTLDVIVVVGGVIHILTLLDVNVTALIAGISIGGLAIALAAQDTVKNLIGSVMIFADKPFQIGDLINVKGVTGTVEVVGFRSTQIRTLNSSLVSIPNGILANEIVNNLGLRIYRKFTMTIGTTYQTSPDSLERFIKGIKQVIGKHPKTVKDGFEVALSSLGTSSIDIMLNGNLDVSGWSEELKTKEEILLAIISLAEVLNINFAFPSTSVYIEKTDITKAEKRFETVEELLENFKNQFGENKIEG
ncbi:MAG: MscS family membrane protein [Cognaticolwellia sp.]|jgi:MscS family membrane protein